VPLLRRTILARATGASLDGFRLQVPEGVFHPKLFFSSTILGRVVAASVNPGSTFADLGCGSGIIGLYAARAGARVTGLDINPDAVAAAATNYRVNFPGRSFRCIHSDLFGGLSDGEIFDCIAWNPPFYSGSPGNMADHAWNGGESQAVLRRCAASARLSPGGTVLVISTSDVDQTGVVSAFPESSYFCRILRVEHSWFETFFVYEFTSRR
jgi:methylase of polypeptide subunit release factors